MDPHTEAPLVQAWLHLDEDAARVARLHLRELLRDEGRSARMTVEAAGLVFDFSKQRIDDQALSSLFELTQQADIYRARHRMLKGERINTTEDRPVLHTALRGVGGTEAIAREVSEERQRLAAMADALRGHQMKGFSGKPLTALVCIGIGGSDLGPRLVVDALRPADPRRRPVDVRFVANVDPSDLRLAIADLDPESTAFAIVSKTFTTRETLANAQVARQWIRAAGAGEESVRQHMIGITAAPDAAQRWGILPDRVLKFWDWVGGRYSLWSSVGLSIAVACGNEVHASLLDGAAAMDVHFRDTPTTANLPIWLGLMSVWNRNALGFPTQAVIPYAERLRLLPDFLQQLVMESNGKSAMLDGRRASRVTAPIVWGVSGTNAQHSFFQQLHQGPDIVPVDFVLPIAPEQTLASDDPRQQILIANCLAQSAALALGKPAPGEKDGPENWHTAFTGNRPSTMMLLPRVDAHSLGALLAAYEHATFVASVVLGINAFDQFGVEYGKVMASSIEKQLESRDSGAPAGEPGLDPSTSALIARLR